MNNYKAMIWVHLVVLPESEPFPLKTKSIFWKLNKEIKAPSAYARVLRLIPAGS